MIYLQISTAQGPAECRQFAGFALHTLVTEAAQAQVTVDVLEQSGDEHGIRSAVIVLTGKNAETFAQQQQGTWQWTCPSRLRPRHPRKIWYIGVCRLPALPPLPAESEVVFQTCRASGKGGQHVNTTDSAVRATHLASGISVRVAGERSQHANKKRARELLALKLAEQHQQVLDRHARQQHNQLYQVARGNPQRVFVGPDFREKSQP